MIFWAGPCFFTWGGGGICWAGPCFFTWRGGGACWAGPCFFTWRGGYAIQYLFTANIAANILGGMWEGELPQDSPQSGILLVHAEIDML